MTHHFALVVEWQLPDDVDHAAADATLRALLDKIHAGSPAPAERVTAYLGVSAELIAEAASTGAIVDQAQRLQLQPDDAVTIRLTGLTAWPEDDFETWADAAKLAFPNHKVVFLGHDTTIEAGPAGEATA